MDELSVALETTRSIPVSQIPPLTQDARRSHERKLAVYLVLASTIFERLAFYSLAINLVVSLKSTVLRWDSSTSTTASFIFFGTSYVSAILFAALSDAKLGRAKTIIIGFILYSIGYIMIILISSEKTHRAICGNATVTHNSVFSEHCGVPIIGTLVFMAIGIGAVQVNMTVFGAEQIQETKMAIRYFDKYYVVVNIGATIATLFISLIQTEPNNQLYSSNYFYGYLLALTMLISAILIFVIGYRFYVHTSPSNTIILQYIPVLINAFKTRRYHGQSSNRDSTMIHTWINRNSFPREGTTIQSTETLTFLDYANVTNYGKYNDDIINDIRSFHRAIIVYFLLVPYWIIYYQIQITFPLQGERMYIPILYNNVKMPVSWMSLGDSITIIIGIIILKLFVYKYLDNRNRIISIKIKLIIGMILASLTMIITGTIEIIRQKNCIPKEKDSSLNILYQLPQNIFMGLTEIFAVVASLEFAYLAAPRSGQSLFMSLQFFSLGISSFIGNGYFSIYSSSSIANFDFSCISYYKWTFTAYFYILAALQLAFLVIIILCDRKFHLFKLNPLQIQTYQFQGD